MKIFKKIIKAIGVLALGVGLFLCSALMGYLVAASLNDSSKLPVLLEYSLFIVGTLLGLLICIIVHEAGHLIFGLISGYGFSSFRIGSLMWIKQNGKIKFRRLSISGTGGQCLMVPPEEQNGKIPVVLYNLGGVIMNLLLSAVFVALYVFIPSVPVLSDIFIACAAISFISAITNGIPLAPGGLPNDGMNSYYLAGNKTAAIAFRNQLLINAEYAKGVRASEMPPEWFTLPDGADMQNVLCTSIAVFKASRTIESMDFEAAQKEIKALLKSNWKMASVHRNLLACDLVFCRLALDGAKAEISSLLTIEQQKFMKSMKNFPSVLRTEYAIAIIRDKNAEKAEKIEQRFKKVEKTYPYPQDVNTERGFMEYAKARAEKFAEEESRVD